MLASVLVLLFACELAECEVRQNITVIAQLDPQNEGQSAQQSEQKSGTKSETPNETSGASQNVAEGESQGVVSESQDAAQEKTQGPAAGSSEIGDQEQSQNANQEKPEITTSGSSQNGIQNEKVLSGAATEIQNGSEGSLKYDVSGESKDGIQEVSQNGAREESQRGTSGGLGLENNIHGGSQDGSQEMLNSKFQEKLQRESSERSESTNTGGSKIAELEESENGPQNESENATQQVSDWRQRIWVWTCRVLISTEQYRDQYRSRIANGGVFCSGAQRGFQTEKEDVMTSGFQRKQQNCGISSLRKFCQGILQGSQNTRRGFIRRVSGPCLLCPLLRQQQYKTQGESGNPGGQQERSDTVEASPVRKE